MRGQTDRKGETKEQKGETKRRDSGKGRGREMEGQGWGGSRGKTVGESEEQRGECGSSGAEGGLPASETEGQGWSLGEGHRSPIEARGCLARVGDQVPAPLPTSPANPPAARKSVLPPALLPSLPWGRQALLPSQIQSLHLCFSELGMKEGEASAALKPADGQIFIIFARMGPRKPTRDSSKSI